jgi:DNA polymerase-4
LDRKIIHFDMDAYYASIEVRDDPTLKGRPIVVGGSPQSRGVVCTASYEARKFGIRSAMPCSQAARLCPDAIFLRPDFERYSAVSKQIRAVFGRYTDVIEPLSLDEAYLDVTNNARGLYAVKIASLIQQEIRDELKLSGSAGIAPNKLVAKIASDVRKPAGLTVVLPDQVAEFMRALPLRKIHGIGPATEKRLQAIGLSTCDDVRHRSLDDLIAALGENTATWLYDRARGIDHRPVEARSVRKSLGQEDTFAKDVLDLGVLEAELRRLSLGVAEELERTQLKGRTITLKVRYDDFRRITRSRSFPIATRNPDLIFSTVCELLKDTDAGKRKIRLLGVTLANLDGSPTAP